jgi:hypothetical protein
MLPIAQIVLNSLLFLIIFGVIIWGTLWLNPRIFMNDFPDLMKAAQPPLQAWEKQQQKVVMVVFIIVFVGLPVFLNAQLRANMGAEFSFAVAYLNTWLMFQLANLYDAVGIDWVIATRPPKFAIASGTEPYLYLLLDKQWHLLNFAKGFVALTAIALVFAVVAVV